MKTLNIIGAGRVGRTLAHLWCKQGVFAVQDVLTRSQTSADEAIAFIGSGRAVTLLSDMKAADVWMLAVPDGQINAVAKQMSVEIENRAKTALFNASNAIVFHNSGALASAELQPLHGRGFQLASAHCLLSFSAPSSAIHQFAGTPCALEGDSLATQALQSAFEAIGGNCFELAAKDKILYHAAAVFATNFLPVLQVIATDLWQNTGMPKEMIESLSTTLLQKSVQNIVSQGAAKALTGPAARGDTDLVALQGSAVANWQVEAGEAYVALSKLASQIAKHGTIQH